MLGNVKVFKDSRAPNLSFHWNGGYAVSIHDDTANEEIGVFSLQNGRLDESNVEEEIVEMLNENPHFWR